jgi:hypothetical protein
MRRKPDLNKKSTISARWIFGDLAAEQRDVGSLVLG